MSDSSTTPTLEAKEILTKTSSSLPPAAMSSPPPPPMPERQPTVRPLPPPTVTSSPALLETPQTGVNHRRSFQALFNKVIGRDHEPSEPEPLVALRYDDMNAGKLPKPKPPSINPYSFTLPEHKATRAGGWSDSALVVSPLDGHSGYSPEDLTPSSSLSSKRTVTPIATSGLAVPSALGVGSAPVVMSTPIMTSAPGLRSSNSYSAHHQHSSSTDIFSVAHSGLDGLTLNVSIADLCKNIRQSASGGRASRIPEIIWHKEQGGVRHEYLVIKVIGDPNSFPNSPLPSSSNLNGEVSNGKGKAPESSDSYGGVENGQTTWLRLDRAAQKGYSGFFQIKSSSAIFPANDTVS